MRNQDPTADYRERLRQEIEILHTALQHYAREENWCATFEYSKYANHLNRMEHGYNIAQEAFERIRKL